MDTVIIYKYEPFSSVRNFESRHIYSYNYRDSIIKELLQNYTDNQWVNNVQSFFVYDAKGNFLEEKYQIWDVSNGNWENYSRSIFTLGTLDKAIEKYQQTWDLNTNDWYTDLREEYEYDYKANIIKKTRLIYQYPSVMPGSQTQEERLYDQKSNCIQLINTYHNFTTNQQFNTSLFSYAFDLNNNLISKIEKQWNTNSSDWYNYSRETYAFNEENNLLIHSFENWNSMNNAWDDNLKIINEYDGSGQLLLSTTELSKELSTNTWTNKIRYLMIYNSHQYLTIRTTQLWTLNGNVGYWRNDNQENFIYFLENIVKERIVKKWNSSLNNWYSFEIVTNTYNSNQQLIKTEKTQWNSLSLTWQNISQWNFEYDSNGGNVAFEDFTYWSSQNQDYISKYRYEYKCRLWSLIHNVKGNSKIYPNPIYKGNSLFVKIEDEQDFQLYDYFGRMVIQEHLKKGENTINTINLKGGVYMVKIDGKIHKIVVR